MTHRYYAEPPIEGDGATLRGSEAHHLAHVMRGRPGDRVTLFDGSGDQWEAEVVRVGRSEVELRLIVRQTVDRELPFDLILGVAMPKGDRQRWLVEKAVESGVRRLVPLATARSVAEPSAGKLQRTVIEASKQCGRNRLMELASAVPWTEFLAQTRSAEWRLMAHPGGAPIEAGLSHPTGQSVVVAVGPEGGFTDEEVSLAVAAGWELVDLGPRTLRIETAAIVLAAATANFRPSGIQNRIDAPP